MRSSCDTPPIRSGSGVWVQLAAGSFVMGDTPATDAVLNAIAHQWRPHVYCRSHGKELKNGEVWPLCRGLIRTRWAGKVTLIDLPRFVKYTTFSSEKV